MCTEHPDVAVLHMPHTAYRATPAMLLLAHKGRCQAQLEPENERNLQGTVKMHDTAQFSGGHAIPISLSPEEYMLD